MKTGLYKLKRAFTLLELTIAMMIGLMIGTMILAIFNQQLAFLRIFKAQSFISDEAPLVSMYVSRVVAKADRFRLHASVSDALAGTNPRLTSSPGCVLNFVQPDGSLRASILSFANLGSGPALYYYVVPKSGVLGAPQWAVTTLPTNVEFFVDQGILRTRLTGPQGEQITYSGTTK